MYPLTEALTTGTAYEDLELAKLNDGIPLASLDFFEFASEWLIYLSNAQITISIVGLFIAILALPGPSAVAFSVYLIARLVTLFVVGVGCRHIFDPNDFRPRHNLTLVALYLQGLWLFAECILGVSPPLIVVAHVRQLTSGFPFLGTLLVSPVPAAIMVSFSGLKTYLARMKHRRNSKSLGSNPSSPVSNSSRSSNGVFSGGSSPTGYCSPRIRHHNSELDTDVVLMEHVLDTNESVMFVHKKLSPIKTRPNANPPPFPRSVSYNPILAPMLAGIVDNNANKQQLPAVTNNNANHHQGHAGLRPKNSSYGPPVKTRVHATVSVVNAHAKPVNVPYVREQHAHPQRLTNRGVH